ncbi:MAG: GxxExxY protein [Bacteroidales bacterium]|nr:GxxExxY protein [Bacteroidales bacterium]
MTHEQLIKLTHDVIGAAFEIKRILGSHLYERTYEEAMKIELKDLGYICESQVQLPVLYKGHEIQNAYRIDLLVEGILPLELKALPYMGANEVSQILSYLTFGNFLLGYLINFHASDMKPRVLPKDDSLLYSGIYRVISPRSFITLPLA